MSILERLTRKATKTAGETIRESGQEAMKEKMDILEGVIKIGALVFVTVAAIRGASSHSQPSVSVPVEPVHAYRPDISITNLYFGKEGLQ